LNILLSDAKTSRSSTVRFSPSGGLLKGIITRLCVVPAKVVHTLLKMKCTRNTFGGVPAAM
jgi:hypothetical protein